jgi:hypothetical protein
MPQHRYTTAYSLAAFDVETGKQVFQWPNIADTERARPAANATIIAPDGQHWLVIGVLYDSTVSEWRIDVKKSQ